MFKTIKNALKTPEVRKKLLYTVLLIVVFRFGCYITVPGVNSSLLKQEVESATGTLTGLINTISGGAFSRLSIFAMSISPYITASIVIQLLGMIIPSLEKTIKEGGEAGKRKVNLYTKLLTVVLAAIEAVGIYISYSKNSSSVFIDPSFKTGAIFVIALMAGTALLMWLGEQITSKGIGNGISMLIFVGIISGLPNGALKVFNLAFNPFTTANFIIALGIIIGAIVLVSGVVFVQEAERRVPVQYAKKVVGRKMYGGQNTHIPLKLAMAGVMPVIFASSFMTFPAMLIQIFSPSSVGGTGFLSGLYQFSIATSTSQGVGIGYAIANAVVYLFLILGFTFFYTYATFNPAEVANTIKKNGGFVPGIRAGKPTADYISSILLKLTWFGGLFLSIIAVIPMLMRFGPIDLAFGGTSILIVVGVALETVQQLESQLVMRHYKGFLE
ncbi:MAG: preprotein translocase subunit SecY [Clostridia bacterium]|nr:preprotein translocase subunit SecY [Clostridia bacterium]